MNIHPYLTRKDRTLTNKMPAKTPKKGKQANKATDKVPVKSQDSIGVRECMVWDRRSKRGSGQAREANDSQREHRFLMKKERTWQDS